MRSFFNDLRTAVRSFRHRPGFAAAVVATLALGIAPNCVIFSVLDGVYFRPLPYPAQERLALLNTTRLDGTELRDVDPFTFAAWQRVSAFESAALYRGAGLTLNEGERPERVPGQMVTADFFRAVGVQPIRGRGFEAEDCRPGAPSVLVISHRTWKEYFGGRPDVVGLHLKVDGAPATVIGVMGPDFRPFMEGRAARAWAPFVQAHAEAPTAVRGGSMIARLKADASLDRARAEVAAAHGALTRQFPEFYRPLRPAVRDFRASLFGGLGPGLRMLSVVVALLLLIACGNAANLLLARAAERGREVAVRSALGARRLQVMRGMVAESLLFAGAAAVVGLGLSYWGIQLLWAKTAPIFRVIGVEGFAFDRRMLTFAVLLTLLTTLLFGVLPAFASSRADITNALKGAPAASGRGFRRSKVSGALVVAQVALCVVAMISTMVVLRGVAHFAHAAAHPGFHPQDLLIATLPAPGGPAGGPRRSDQLQDIEARLAALPGVERVALMDRVPFLDAAAPAPVHKRAAGASDQAGDRLQADLRVVDADFFAAMSIPLLHGRGFTVDDDATSLPVVVISDRLASAYWNKADPLGERILVDKTWRTIVGVAGSTTAPSPFQLSAREAFVPYLQADPGALKVVVRSRSALTTLAPLIRKQVQAVDPEQPVADLQTMEQAIDATMTPFRLIVVLMGLFGSIALLLAAVGLYGVIAHGVARRTRELGIRMALGADRARVGRLVLRDGLRLAVIGLALGLLPAMAIARILPTAIFGVAGLSPLHYAATLGAWLAVALAACLLPARRAARVEPIVALRAE